MTDRRDRTTITLEPAHDRPRRLVLEPRSDGRYSLVTKEFRDGCWRVTGSEAIDNVTVALPSGRRVAPTTD